MVIESKSYVEYFYNYKMGHVMYLTLLLLFTGISIYNTNERVIYTCVCVYVYMISPPLEFLVFSGPLHGILF